MGGLLRRTEVVDELGDEPRAARSDDERPREVDVVAERFGRGRGRAEAARGELWRDDRAERVEHGDRPALDVRADEALVVERVGRLADEGLDRRPPRQPQHALEPPQRDDLARSWRRRRVVVLGLGNDGEVDEVAAAAARVEEAAERVGELGRAAHGRVGVGRVEEGVVGVDRQVEPAGDVVSVRVEVAAHVLGDLLDGAVLDALGERLVGGGGLVLVARELLEIDEREDALVARGEEPHDARECFEGVSRAPPPERAPDRRGGLAPRREHLVRAPQRRRHGRAARLGLLCAAGDSRRTSPGRPFQERGPSERNGGCC
mmetsp:Transcript_15133/g.60768  ORF Transcript_15133/g.60768 Transcript_15133/m.60768 type:complete len:318 (+) Transcript_15133:252-1205(+)